MKRLTIFLGRVKQLSIIAVRQATWSVWAEGRRQRGIAWGMFS